MRKLKSVARLVLYLGMVLLGLMLPAQGGAQGAESIKLLQVEGAITPVVMEYIQRGVEVAESEGANLLVITLDTPGGSVELTRQVTRTMQEARVPILVTGATAAGKTTIINALAGELDPLDAVVCIEDTRELDFPGRNVSYLVTRPPSPEGEGAQSMQISQRYLAQQALRKRPDWIVLGEARGAEAWDFAQAGNTGHAIMGSVHANSARDAVDRYRDLCLEAGENLRENVVLRGVVRAFRLVVYVEMDGRLRRRVVKHIAEVTGNVTEQNVPVLQDLFSFSEDEERLACTGARPYPLLGKLLERDGCSYEEIIRGEGIPATWAQEAQRWVS